MSAAPSPAREETPQQNTPIGQLKLWATRSRASRQAWLESYGVPISNEFAQFAEAIGTLIELAENLDAGARSVVVAPQKEKADGEVCDHGISLNATIGCRPCFDSALNSAMRQAESGSAAHIDAGAPFLKCHCVVCGSLRSRLTASHPAQMAALLRELEDIPKAALSWSNHMADGHPSTKTVIVYESPTPRQWSDEAKKYAAECLANAYLIQKKMAEKVAQRIIELAGVAALPSAQNKNENEI